MTTQTVHFEEEQSFGAHVGGLMLGIFGSVTAIFASVAILEPAKRGSLIVPCILFCVVIGGVTLLLFMTRLNVQVDAEHIHVRFFPFFKKDIPLTDVVCWEVRTYNPLLEYGGWGIRLSLDGKNSAYNMKGKRGVQLEFTSGKRLLIGSQQAEEFAAALGQAKDQR